MQNKFLCGQLELAGKAARLAGLMRIVCLCVKMKSCRRRGIKVKSMSGRREVKFKSWARKICRHLYCTE